MFGFTQFIGINVLLIFFCIIDCNTKNSDNKKLNSTFKDPYNPSPSIFPFAFSIINIF